MSVLLEAEVLDDMDGTRQYFGDAARKLARTVGFLAACQPMVWGWVYGNLTAAKDFPPDYKEALEKGYQSYQSAAITTEENP